MPRAHTSSMHRIAIVMLIALLGYGIRCQDAVAVDTYPAAPTIPDAHHYFKSLVSNNGVTALYETKSRSGDIVGYESFPVQEYTWVACKSGVVLKNGVKIGIDWSVVEKSQLSDGTLSILQGPNVQFIFFHMLLVEGGVVVEPSSTIPRLIFGINDELSRNRLSKAVDLLSSACRAKSKFD
jgi:hypothetical protein